MPFQKILVTLLVMVSSWINSSGQRSYSSNSVLASGNWYRFAVTKEGAHRIDVSFLAALGINPTNIPSNSIRIFGNGGRMLPEGNDIARTDDLQEIAILVNDGGDGLFNGNDRLFFYATGPHEWKPDSINKRFNHKKNIYSDSSFYFITIGGNGKRITTSMALTSPSVIINTYNERSFHELDTINLLSSGKEWFGEEFSDAPGKTLSRSFSVNIPARVTTEPVTLITNCIARSVNTASRFDVRINGQTVQQLTVPSTGAGIYDLFAQQVHQPVSTSSLNENVDITYSYVPGAFNSQGWLNFFEIHTRRKMDAASGQFHFRDWNSIGNHNGEFVISNATGTSMVFDVTDPLVPFQMPANFQSGELRFINTCERLREYVVFDPSNAFIPVASGAIANQNIHATGAIDHIIVTNPKLLAQAEQLAELHRQRNNLRVLVVTTDKVYNEFSSGSQDPAAIRDMIKMFYDRATTSSDKPRYLLLFGDGSFDYKNRIQSNTDLVPAYQTISSLDPLSTYTSDDFFGFLDDNEDINSGLITNLLDVGIGRLPARSIEEAKNFVDKIRSYYSSESLGPWRTNLTFVADDEDQNLHLDDAEIVSATAASNPVFNQHKIYLDAFPQQSNTGGERYPLVNDAIINRIYNGTLIWNYNGHGGPRRLAEETILDLPLSNSWNNKNRLPLVITATCDFAPFDNPFISSLGESLLLRPQTGTIALMTTTRIVFAFSNRQMNDTYMRFALEQTGGEYRTVGQAVQTAKNHLYQTSGDITNNRKFTLLGDPALRLAFPTHKISTTRINNSNIPAIDTLSAGETAIIEGEVTDNNGALLPSFNGTIYPVVFDKPVPVQTLGNDPGSPVTTFTMQNTVLFRGKATVTSGKFRFEFKVPRDILFTYGNGRISYYAENGSVDGAGAFSNFIVGGSSGQVNNDNTGPEINAWLNDERFVNGSIVNQRPVLLLKLFDSSGINTTGTGVGHDISVTVDNDNDRFYVLNDHYEADLDDFRKGVVRFQLPDFEPGTHSLRIKVWDAMNNSNEAIIEFTVVNDQNLTITRVLNYPNPFTTNTQFWFEHNRPGQDLFVQILIYSLSGRVVRTLEKTINTPGNRSIELEWDARDEFGDKVGRGVYIYKITIHSHGTKPRTVIEKLVVL